MRVAKHSAETHLVVDPVQDYEESMRVLGAYGSTDAARMALPRLRRIAGECRNGIPSVRHLEIQHWRGDQLVSSEKHYDPAENP